MQVSKNAHSLTAPCRLTANNVFAGMGDPAYLAGRLASMAAQSPSRRAKAVPTEYASLTASGEWDFCRTVVYLITAY